MNVKIRVLSAGVLFFMGHAVSAQKAKNDTIRGEIDEVVITGSYGIRQTPEQVTGSSVKIGSDKLVRPSAVSIENALQGQVAGLMSTASSGQPGANSITLIRGLGSLTSGNNPLYILDGVPIPSGDVSGLMTSQNSLSLINPADIENIEVLKDGVATAVYGSRGANGVIVITTKSGKKGRSDLNFTSEIGAGEIAFEKFKMLNASESTNLFGLSLFNAGQATTLQNGYNLAKSEYAWDGVSDYDWNRAVRRANPSFSRYNLNYSGGVENLLIFASLGYLQQEGISRDSKFDRYNAALRADWKASEKLKMNMSVNLSRSVQTGATDGSAFSNPVFTGRLMSPTQSFYNPDGTYNTKLYYISEEFNPIGIQNENLEKGIFNKIITSIGADYQFLPNFRYSSNFGLDYTSGNELVYWNPDFGDGTFDGDANGNGYLGRQFNNYLTWNWYNFVHYNKIFADKHDVSVSVGLEATRTEREFNFLSKQGFPAGTRIKYADVGANPTGATGNADFRSLVGYVTRASYTYNKFLTFTGSFRRDGYSGFTGYNGNFWGAGLSFDFGKANILPGFFKSLKLRASYGENGNQAVGPYPKYDQYSYRGAYISSNAGFVSNVAPVEGLYWEKSDKSNIGLDFTFGKNGVVYGTVEVYKNNNTDQIFSVLNPASTGFNSLTKNIADSYSKGLEATLGFKVGNGEGLNWNTKFNYAYNDSRIKSLNGETNPTTIDGFKAFFPGHNPTEFYTRLWAGVDPKNGDPLWYTDDSKTATTNNSGLAKLSFTGKHALPTHIGSWYNELNYKNFKLSFLINYQGNYSVYDRWAFVYDSSGQYGYLNQLSSALYNSWTPENPNASQPKYVYGGNKIANSASTRYLFDGDHVRLRNVEFGYRFTKDVLKIDGVKGIYIYARGINLLTYAFDKNLYFDPESNSNAFTYTASNLGVYDQTQPNLRQYMLGVSIDF
ncbi:SusC/RagA family TonB-linked outer membrane protein [Chryseobacterium sp. L7]|uniref:SusC/RagA family TonB-linked outer membrane protein n=1 Tax=Chryseobacterium endalhagicum TaxID=2797638 RepID=A0ABS1QCK6_9FLAO|nr:SusC/RagA family TonB-linked outer membrane protein [Chryseobacterium endalhagicum]MBL1220022.1 SusC/RagA family TonB-linked outer membrane protein [Chryseobacterium endalhagicum]